MVLKAFGEAEVIAAFKDEEKAKVLMAKLKKEKDVADKDAAEKVVGEKTPKRAKKSFTKAAVKKVDISTLAASISLIGAVPPALPVGSSWALSLL